MSNDLVRAGQRALLKSNGSVSGTAGKVMVGAGAGSLGIVVLAGFIPFVGPVLLSIIMIVLGVLLWEK